MNKAYKKNLLLISILFLAFAIPTVAYVNFNVSKPKINRNEEKEVRGSKTGSAYTIPYPTEYEEIRVDETNESRQITLAVEKSPQEVQDFYKMILLERGWEIETETKGNTFYGTEYKLKKNRINIVSAREENSKSTIVSISIVLED